MTRLDRSIQGLVGALAELAFNVVPAAAYLVLSIAVMFRLDARLAVLVLAFAPLARAHRPPRRPDADRAASGGSSSAGSTSTRGSTRSCPAS